LRSPYPRLSLSYTEIYYYELLLYFKLKALYYIIVQMTRAKKSGLGGSAMELKISDEVRTLCPDTALGVLFYRAEVAESPQALLDKFDDAQRTLGERYTLETIADIPHIASTRDAYRALGKSPHEYRNAAEAMLRRIVKGSGLYRINNVVDVNNLISVSSGYSIGSYDVSGLSGASDAAPGPGGQPLRRHRQGKREHRPPAGAVRRSGALRQPLQRQPPGDDPPRAEGRDVGGVFLRRGRRTAGMAPSVCRPAGKIQRRF
jgi:hypothetical protein